MDQTKGMVVGVNFDHYIKIAADTVTELRKVDVYRVINSVRSDNIDAVTRSQMATYISQKRPDLVAEVTEVMSEDFPGDKWSPVGNQKKLPEVSLSTIPGGAGQDVMALVIKHGKTENTINGPYFVVVMRGDRVTSSVSGILTAEACQRRAEEYADSFGATIVTPALWQDPTYVAGSQVMQAPVAVD